MYGRQTETAHENAKIKNSCREFMALKKVPTRPQLGEPDNVGYFTEGSGSQTKLDEASESDFFLTYIPLCFVHAF